MVNIIKLCHNSLGQCKEKTHLRQFRLHRMCFFCNQVIEKRSGRSRLNKRRLFSRFKAPDRPCDVLFPHVGGFPLGSVGARLGQSEAPQRELKAVWLGRSMRWLPGPALSPAQPTLSGSASVLTLRWPTPPRMLQRGQLPRAPSQSDNGLRRSSALPSAGPAARYAASVWCGSIVYGEDDWHECIRRR